MKQMQHVNVAGGHVISTCSDSIYQKRESQTSCAPPSLQRKHPSSPLILSSSLGFSFSAFNPKEKEQKRCRFVHLFYIRRDEAYR